MQKRYLIVYDITHARRLQKVAKILLNIGVRVQKSVFEAHLTDAALNRLTLQLEKVTEPEDGIKIFQLCEKCTGKRTSLGNAPLSIPIAEWIVL